MKILILGAIVFFMTACSHNPNEVVAVEKEGQQFLTDEHAADALAQGDDEAVVCERRVITGSHRVTRVCTTKKQKQKEQEEGRDKLELLREQQIRNAMPKNN